MKKEYAINRLMDHVRVFKKNRCELTPDATGEDAVHYHEALDYVREQLEHAPALLLEEIVAHARPLAIGVLPGGISGMDAWETGVFCATRGYPSMIPASAYYIKEGLRLGNGVYATLATLPSGEKYGGAIGLNYSRSQYKREYFGASYGTDFPLIHEMAHHWLISTPSPTKDAFLKQFNTAINADRAAISPSLCRYISSLRDAYDAEQEYLAFALEMACGGQKKFQAGDTEPLFDFSNAPHITQALCEQFPDLATNIMTKRPPHLPLKNQETAHLPKM